MDASFFGRVSEKEATGSDNHVSKVAPSENNQDNVTGTLYALMKAGN
jgi:hypothetical protein